MEHLEINEVVHRDLAARNVLVHTPLHVRICDFGLARSLETLPGSECTKLNGDKVPIRWIALESIQSSIFNHKTDIWSYGVTLWELFTFGEKPYDIELAPDPRGKKLQAFLERGERLRQPQICTIDVYMILIKCWTITPESRPTFSDHKRTFLGMFEDPPRWLHIEGDKLIRQPSSIPSADDNEDLLEALELESSGIVTADNYFRLNTNTTSESPNSPVSTDVLLERCNPRHASSSSSTSHRYHQEPKGILKGSRTVLLCKEGQNPHTQLELRPLFSEGKDQQNQSPKTASTMLADDNESCFFNSKADLYPSTSDYYNTRETDAPQLLHDEVQIINQEYMLGVEQDGPNSTPEAAPLIRFDSVPSSTTSGHFSSDSAEIERNNPAFSDKPGYLIPNSSVRDTSESSIAGSTKREGYVKIISPSNELSTPVSG